MNNFGPCARRQAVLSAEQLASLFETRLEIVPPPEPGYFIDVRGLVIQYRAGSIPFELGDPGALLGVLYAGTLDPNQMICAVEQAGLLDQADDMISTTAAAFGGFQQRTVSRSIAEGAALLLSTDAPISTGDGIVIVTVDYALVPLL